MTNSVSPQYDHYGRLGVKCQNAKYLKFCLLFSGWAERGKVCVWGGGGGGGGGDSIIDMCLV